MCPEFFKEENSMRSRGSRLVGVSAGPEKSLQICGMRGIWRGSWERTCRVFVRELVVLRGQARPVCGILEGQEKGKLRLGRLWSNGQESEGYPKCDGTLLAGFKQGSGRK